MQGSPKPPGTVVINLNDESSLENEQSCKKAILQKIIKFEDFEDPVAVYGTDTESEDPKPQPTSKQPREYEMRTTRR
jgi:hypothetical protein